MTPEHQRIAIAEACGWSFIHRVDKPPHGLPPNGKNDRYSSPLPDYLNDLNAMHEAEKLLTYKQHVIYTDTLEMLIGGPGYKPATCATAAQRAEALVITLGL
jgi:hypothetical protein